MAGEYIGSFSTRGAGNARIQISAGLDVGELTALALALDVCARVAVSGQAKMKIIVAVFGVAIILIIVWAILFFLGTRKK